MGIQIEDTNLTRVEKIPRAFPVLFAAEFSEVLNSPVEVGLVVVFFASALVVITTTFGFATKGENRRAQGLDKD